MNQYYSEYKRKLTSPDKAVEYIGNGETIINSMSFAEPPALLAAIARVVREKDLTGIKIYSLLPLKHSAETVLAPDLCNNITGYTWFVGSLERGLVRTGLNYFIPCYLHQIPRLIEDHMDVDTLITTVSPMDDSGYFSLGLSNGYLLSAAKKSKKIILEVNENMPRVFGDCQIHISEIEAVVENHVPLLELPILDSKPEDDAIGKYIVQEIPDGATIQLGIGGLPNVICRYLANHKDIGIHTELLTPGMIDLIEKGVATGRKKNLKPGKHIFTVASGNKKMYDFMNNNPSMESYSSDYVTDPAVIARNDNMIAVNAVLEVDLLGQCNAEYLKGSTFSGTGGQLDFVRGAFNSKGGKSIHAFYSTAKNGEISRIVPRFKSGAVITSPRADTHYVCTEYGIVNLKGKSTRERVLALISIAHPKFRDGLLKEAEEMYLM
ncbi:MAG: acetyl-CoA hydrolase/transferase C-terminal domain-containing protein [Candidatus Cloacimonadales bacterium]|nr:acetyl-CoA hydrolase/transferase C-terminal domain-containing protein [Candidatus Cloacimonadales bacterium]